MVVEICKNIFAFIQSQPSRNSSSQMFQTLKKKQKHLQITASDPFGTTFPLYLFYFTVFEFLQDCLRNSEKYWKKGTLACKIQNMALWDLLQKTIPLSYVQSGHNIEYKISYIFLKEVLQ